VHAREVNVITLIQGDKQFVVPLFQRTYSWQEKHYTALWRDVYERSTSPADASGHFLGSVVLAPSPNNSAAGPQRWLVIDGQQRLTTLMLLLAAIRDHVRVSDPISAERIADQCLVNKYQHGDLRLRLLPTQADRSAYRSIVLGDEPSSQADGLTAAYQYFRSRLTSVDDPADDQDILAIENVVRTGLSMVEIDVEHGDNEYRIFESLNNTGLALTQADLLRNYLFMRLPKRGEGVFADLWLPMQQQLTNGELELLVWLDLVVRGDERVRQSEVYQAQQLRLEQLGASEEVIEGAITDLARRATYLIRILKPQTEPDPRLRARLERLAAWRSQTAYPLVMHLYDLLSQGATTAAEVAAALESIESFLVRRMICYVPTNNLNRIFNSAPREIGVVADVGDAVRRYLSTARRAWPSDAAVRKAALERPFYWTGRAPQRAYVLRQLEESYGSPEPVDYTRAKLTVEHVLPQAVSEEWLQQLANEVVDGQSPRELHDELVHTLGNLTLTAENSRLSNSLFQRKQDILAASALTMNKEIAATEHWGKAAIQARSERLANKMTDIWPGPARQAGDAEQSGRDWSMLRQAVSLIPPGTWTTYGDLAELIGSHAVPVGVYLATKPVPNAWRVLTTGGMVATGFRWTDGDRDGDPHDLLAAEGIEFTAKRASAAQRLGAQELAELLGMDVTIVDQEPTGVDDQTDKRLGEFCERLAASRPEAVEPVRALIYSWTRMGGVLAYASGSTATCFPVLRNAERPDLDIWPLAIQPEAGRIEVPFRRMRLRPPFDDITVRKELRQRLNAVPGIKLPAGKIGMRPSFEVNLLADAFVAAEVTDVLEWFVLVVRSYAAAVANDVAGLPLAGSADSAVTTASG